MLLLRGIALRACIVWLLVHGMLFVLSGGEVRGLSLHALLLLALFGGIVGVVDSRRRQEFLFLMNMGIPGSAVPLIWVASIAALEGLLHVAMRLIL